MPEQLSLPLFDPPTFQELIDSRGLDTVRVSLNRRLRRSWHVTIQPHTGLREMVVPAFLEEAPGEIKETLLEWATLPDPRRSSRRAQIRRRKAELEKRVWDYIEAYHPEKKRTPKRIDPSVYEKGTRGAVYDLREVFDCVNRRYFQGSVSSALRWGEYASLTSYQTTRTAPDGSRYNLITIAGAYNHPRVPRFAIEGVMHHEMLHIVVPPTQGTSRRTVHGRAFRRAERKFLHLREWTEWQHVHVRRLAAAMRRRRPR